MMVGLQGSGKTTTAGKLARKLKGEGRQVRLVAADVYRPAAIDQLETVGAQVGVPVYADRSTKDVVRIARDGIEQAKRERDRVVIVDTAGRLQIDADMMQELKRLKEAVRPEEILFVADGMTGQEAVRIAQGFDEALNVTGVILTKMDGDARGGAALSIYGITKKPIKYIGVGEKLDALEDFHPDRMAGRILQQGDILTLVEKAQGAIDEDEAKRLEKKMRKEGMDLEDFLTAMKQMQKLGPLENLLKLLPGVNASMLKQAKIDPKRMKHLEAIITSMTPKERKHPELMNGSRRLRVAKGSGRPVQEVNKLLDQFREMSKMMKKMAAGGPGGRPPQFPGMPKMPFGRR
jgi:signal recognition particle subunit SRP54